MYVYAGIENKNVSIAQDAILEQFSAMQQGKITDEEMQSAKNSIQNQYRTIKDSLFAVESFYRTQNRSGVSASIEDCLKQILQMSAIDIQNIARKIHLDTVYFMQGTELEEGEDNA